MLSANMLTQFKMWRDSTAVHDRRLNSKRKVDPHFSIKAGRNTFMSFQNEDMRIKHTTNPMSHCFENQNNNQLI